MRNKTDSTACYVHARAQIGMFVISLLLPLNISHIQKKTGTRVE